MITKPIQFDGRDPQTKKVGIITMEDIIEELLMEEIEDENEAQYENDREEIRDKIYRLFKESLAGRILNKEEFEIVRQFLREKVGAFS